ncbi:MAG: Ig domain-containing protein, partial [Planctomycetota bacterium]|nr:Ig domain-containing protein [Planctomycetota bacterium]
MAFVFWKPSVSFLSSLVRRTRAPRPAARQRNGFSLRLEPLESRVLLAATNIDAKILSGSLFVTGYTNGNRDVTISTDSNNPSVFLVTPGANTTVNGSTSPASFKFSDVRFNVYVDFLSSFTGFERSVVTIDSKGATLPGSVIVTLQGSGGDTFLMKDSLVRGSVVISSLAGDDTITLENTLITGATTVDASLGRNVTTVTNSTFTLPATFNVGPSGNSTLNVDDSTFASTFVTVSAGQNNLVNLEQNTALPGVTNFNGLAQFSFAGAPVTGGGGTLLLSTANAKSKTNFNGPSVIYGATIAGSAAQTSFAQKPTLILSRFAAIDIVTTTLPAWTQNLAGYSQVISTNGGFGPLQFSVSAGSLPAGLTLNPTSGLISGTPTASGISNFTVKVVDTNGGTDTQAYSLTINAPVLITTATLPAWTQNFAGYLQPVVATGGTGVLTFSLSTGTIPTGLTLNSATGVLSGTPSAVGTFAFTIKATDTIGAS